MKTLAEIYRTLNDKIAILTEGCPITANYSVSEKWINDHCYSYSYLGSEPFDQVATWCEDNFGNNWAWAHNVVYFKYERDYLFFILKWANV